MGSVQTIRLCSFFLLLAAGCAAGRDAGQPCSQTADCRPELACFGGKCAKDDGSCHVVHGACDSDGECCSGLNCNAHICEKAPTPTCTTTGKTCSSSSECCRLLICQAGTCKLPSCAGPACITSANCCTNYTCARFARTCQSARALPIGEACTASAQCTSGVCSDYCTKPCTKHSDCSGSGGNFCMETVSGFLCIPSCLGPADCTVFGTGVSCQGGKDPGGLMLKACFGN